MKIQIQVNTITNEIVDYRTESELNNLRPWGIGDTVNPFVIVCEEMELGQEKEVYPEVNFKFEAK